MAAVPTAPAAKPRRIAPSGVTLCRSRASAAFTPLRLGPRLVNKPGPLLAGKAEVQTAKGSMPPIVTGMMVGMRARMRRSGKIRRPVTSPISTRALFSRSTPTEPQVTDVTPASTAGVLMGDHQRILAGMLGQPLLRLLVKRHTERIGHI